MKSVARKKVIQCGRNNNLYSETIKGKRVYYRFKIGVTTKRIKITNEELKHFDNSTLYYHKKGLVCLGP